MYVIKFFLIRLLHFTGLWLTLNSLLQFFSAKG
jgi:hypothetical protein